MAVKAKLAFSIESIVGQSKFEEASTKVAKKEEERQMTVGRSSDLIDLRKTCEMNRMNSLDASPSPPVLLPSPGTGSEIPYLERLSVSGMQMNHEKFNFSDLLIGGGVIPNHPASVYSGYPLPPFPASTGLLMPPGATYNSMNFPGMLVRPSRLPNVRDYPWWLFSRHGKIFSHPLAGAHHPGFLLHSFRKPKRIRTAFSPGQLLKLEQAFEKNHYVVGTERKQLAHSLGLSETQVKVWFQNRRTKHKRFQQEDCDGKPTTSSQKTYSPQWGGDKEDDNEETEDHSDSL